MKQTRTMLLTIAVVVEVPADTDDEEDKRVMDQTGILEEAINTALGPHPDHLGWASTRIHRIGVPRQNSGQCSICNTWTTDCEGPDPIRGLAIGARVDGSLLCDEDLPAGHPYAF
ncbi:MAG: hypothetical protein H0T53_05000 [Herpetosiphonaceae bacterium]|nr:hypothetical protein [Herpetosiphonaceae bacterium]